MNSDVYTIQARIIADITLFLTVLYAPWWLASIAVFWSTVYFKSFYEAFFFGILFDMLYGASIASFHGFHFVFSSASLFLIFAVDFVKEKVRV